MNTARIFRKTRPLALGLVLALAAGSVAALSSDSDQPIEIEADAMMLDDPQGITIYTGNVIVTQGSMRMTGDKFTVRYTQERDLKDATMEGEPATFRQRPDNSEVDVEGESKIIEYHAPEEMLYLITQAKVTHGERLFSGDRIAYDTARSIVQAEKAPTGDQRVRVVIPPRQREGQ